MLGFDMENKYAFSRQFTSNADHLMAERERTGQEINLFKTLE